MRVSTAGSLLCTSACTTTLSLGSQSRRTSSLLLGKNNTNYYILCSLDLFSKPVMTPDTLFLTISKFPFSVCCETVKTVFSWSFAEPGTSFYYLQLHLKILNSSSFLLVSVGYTGLDLRDKIHFLFFTLLPLVKTIYSLKYLVF